MRPYERLLNYVKYDTASDGNSPTCPSTDKQLVFARVLEQEMREMGLQNVRLDKNG
jgi:tripeptide aminopeptidase